MTRMCVVCKKLYIKGSEKSFHSFPKNENRKQLWLKACNIKLYLPSYKICNDHFLPENYLPSGYLKKNAVPFLASKSTIIKPLTYHDTSSHSPTPMKRLCVEPIVSTNTDIEPVDYHGTSNPCQSPMKRKVFNANSIGILTPSNFKTPREAKKNLDMVKNKYREKQIQNANLKKQIKRLKEKLTTYDNLVQKLHQKLFLTDSASAHLKIKNTVEQDHDYVKSSNRLTPFLDKVTSYNTGFVLKKIKIK
ncbi:uncharacterized protein LOC112594690 [Melanaphis sacchari]|uniref:uncharacterized protein LOC112594690 n=1 Tax=Melanaphis sacchari TaxID=742174 RepID=UPI000DC14A5D|nr:uncharacterized protein LOC112594690 [Melanaphis sacchari]